MRALSTAATGMAAQEMNVQVISNNIANMNTIGYKAQRAEFQDLLYQDIERMGSQSSDAGTIVPTGIQVGTGVKPNAVYRLMSQGSLTQTTNPLDVAVNGRGYFQVQLPTGETAYTRAGNFSVNDVGQMVTADGYTVLPQITIPQNATAITISKAGQVQVTIPGQTAPQTVGQMQLATFFNEAGLDAQGSNLFLVSGASGQPVVGNPGAIGFGTIQQGYTEASNVDAVSEITNLITAQRAYEMNSKVVNSADQMLQTTSQMKQWADAQLRSSSRRPGRLGRPRRPGCRARADRGGAQGQSGLPRRDRHPRRSILRRRPCGGGRGGAGGAAWPRHHPRRRSGSDRRPPRGAGLGQRHGLSPHRRQLYRRPSPARGRGQSCED
jgi:flagellar basal-body rod protein FlgG